MELISRRAFLGGLAAIAAWSKDLADAVNKGRNGLALKGYDAVAYFTGSKAVKGTAAFSATHNGATYLFASAANRDAFLANPDKYVPQFGGYCAWAVGHGYTADADPEAWSVAGGKLYLNYNKSVQKKWLPEKEKWIAEGERNWPQLHK